MKLIINTTNLTPGGGVQVASSFIRECIRHPENQYFVFMTEVVNSQINQMQFPENFKFYLFDQYPGPLKFAVKRKLSLLEREIKPDVVFTVFGPAYWKPDSTHLVGFAIPHLVYLDSPFFSIIPLWLKLFWRFKIIMKKFYFRREGNYFHVETEDVRDRLANFLGVSTDRVFTVSNTASAYFDQQINPDKFKQLTDIRHFKMLFLSAYYTHKNFELLNKLIPALKNKGFDNFRFVLTLPEETFLNLFDEEIRQHLINTGPVKMEDCPALYKATDALFLPTLLECFSANYPEAMKSGRPVLTSDAGFSRSVCRDAALYFDPLNPEDAATAILTLYRDKSVMETLVENGHKRMADFPDAAKKADQLLEILKNIK